MKFEFYSRDNDSDDESESLSEFLEQEKLNFKVDFLSVLADIENLCSTKKFNPVITIMFRSDAGCISFETKFGTYSDYIITFDVELNHVNHDHLIVECYHVLDWELEHGFCDIQKNIKYILSYYESISDTQKIELLARNIAHYFEGRMYFESKALGAKFELLRRGADHFKWGDDNKIQNDIYDLYHFSPVCNGNFYEDRFFKYGH